MREILDWNKVQWDHVRGAVKRKLKDWDTARFGKDVDTAESNFDQILQDIIEEYVPKKRPAKPGPAPWWNYKCQNAYEWKQETFRDRLERPDRYKMAVYSNKKAQKKAYKKYQKKIKKRLASMTNPRGGSP